MIHMLINPHVGWRNIGGEIVAYNCDNQNIVIWNETASLIWEKISQRKSFKEIRDWLTSAYELSGQDVQRDMRSFVSEALNLGFIVGEEGGIADQEKGDASSEAAEKVLLYVEMKAIANLIPFAVTFETTNYCNENCLHCYMDRMGEHLSTDEIVSILEDLAGEGCLFVSFTGGEFFTRRDAVEILRKASELHFAVDVLTNGTLIESEQAEIISQLAVRRVQVSLYGASIATHDAITRTKGSFERTIRAIKLLRERGVKVEIATSLMAINFVEAHAIKDLAESLDCQTSPSPVITARNNGDEATHKFRLSDTQMKEFLADRELASLYAGRKPFKDHQFYFGFDDIREAAPCYSGFNCCAITPQGKVLPCNQLLLEVGDLKKNSFHKIWTGSEQLQYLRSLKIKNLQGCADCPTLDYCSRCPGLALLEGGDLLGPSPENCRICQTLHSLKKEGGE